MITVCLNSGDTLARTVGSVFSQTLLPIQYVFVDGGSTDNTLAIIADARLKGAENGIEVHVIHQTTRGGITEAWNLGLDAARGDAVFILNSDDWYVPYTAERVMERFTEDPELGVVLASGFYTEDNGTTGTTLHARRFFVLPFAMVPIHPACFVRRTTYDRVGNFDPRYRVAADYDFTYRWRKAGVKFANLREVLVNVQMGGYAENNRLLARREVFEIGQRHASLRIFPRLAYLARSILGR